MSETPSSAARRPAGSTRRRIRRLEQMLGAAVCLVGAACLAAACETGAAESAGPAEGSPAPPFSLPALEGGEVRFPVAGERPIILHFWASWCPHCVGEMRLVQALVDELGTEGPRVLAINLGEPSGRVRKFARELGLRYPILLDHRGKVAEAYGVVGLPVTLVISPQGIVARRVRMGELDAGALRTMLRTPAPPAR